MDKKTEDKNAENGKNGQVKGGNGNGTGNGKPVPPIPQPKGGDGNGKQPPQKTGTKATPQKKVKVVSPKQAAPKKKQN